MNVLEQLLKFCLHIYIVASGYYRVSDIRIVVNHAFSG